VPDTNDAGQEVIVATECSLHTAGGRWVLAAAVLAISAAFMWSAVGVALPAIQSYFNTRVAGLQWVFNANLLALSSLILLGGSLGDHYGRRRVFILGMGLFAVGAVLSGLAPTLGLLITCQALQGIGAALMVPQPLAIINACFPENERGQAIGLWAGLAGGIAALGPSLGGWLIDTISWRAAFFMPVPVLVIAIAVTARHVPEARQHFSGGLDWGGTVLMLAGLAGVTYAFIGAPVYGWGSGVILAALAGGAVALGLFVLVESRAARPLVPFSIFRQPLVSGANIFTLLLYFALNGLIFFTILNLQQVQGYSATVAGLAILPPTVIITFLAGPAGALADRIGPRRQMVFGPLVVAAGMTILALGGPDAGYWRTFFPGLVLFGLGMAAVIAPLTKSALAVGPALSGTASGVNNAVARVAAVMAVAVLGAVILSTFSARLDEEIAGAGLSDAQQAAITGQADRLGGITLPDDLDGAGRQSARRAIDVSFVHGYRWVMGTCAGLAAASALVAFLTIHGRRASE
jgi:EmrB/QacA subfamily drug resistance transporter